MPRASIAFVALLLFLGAFALLPSAGCARKARRAEPRPAPAEKDEFDEDGEAMVAVPETKPEPAPDRHSALRVSLDGHQMEPVPRSDMWMVREPVSLDPVLRFQADLRDFQRAFIFISASNERGELTGAAPVTIIDPTRATLVPDEDISLRSPKGCVISSDGEVDRVPLSRGGHYRMELHAEGASGAESVTVLFRTEGAGETDASPFRGLLR